MWDWGGANGFEVDTGSTKNMYPQYAFNSDWGEHWAALASNYVTNVLGKVHAVHIFIWKVALLHFSQSHLSGYEDIITHAKSRRRE